MKVARGVVLRASRAILAVFGAIGLLGQVNPCYGQPDAIKRGLASWYSTEACKVNPDPICPTAAGNSLYELETFQIPYAAMWEVPFGSHWRVKNMANGKSVEVIVLDRGPNKRLKGRVIDLSKQAFMEITHNKRAGLLNVEVTQVQATRRKE